MKDVIIKIEALSRKNQISYDDIKDCFNSSEEMINYIAKGIVHSVFRAGPLEDVHVKSITDTEMKLINKSAVNKMYSIVEDLLNKNPNNLASLITETILFANTWDDAE
ncbi:MAG: hypothetical protein PQJ44_07845 [Sphaerochaetaceae bacterium]|nr:hypothetical protein [Sphaerochaetaceae bacterium]